MRLTHNSDNSNLKRTNNCVDLIKIVEIVFRNVLYPTIAVQIGLAFSLGTKNFPVFKGYCSDDVNQLENGEMS